MCKIKMKNLLKKITITFVFISLISITLFTTTSCKEEKLTQIGILQLATHDALDAARIGFIEALKEAGYEDGKNIKITVMNPEGEENPKNQMAVELVRQSDLILAIATPAAQALQAAQEAEGTNVPILFTAVTDPVSAGLVESNSIPGGNITGTNDMNPVEAQVNLLKELVPSIKKIGIIYNVSEVNSKVQSELAKKEANKSGITCEEMTVADASSIALTVRTLIEKGTQALYLPTDNLIAKNIPAIVDVAEEMKIPVVCGEESMVLNGGSITYGISYHALGKLTGEMAVQILKGAKPSEMAVRSVDQTGLTIAVNEENLNKIGVEIPQSIKDRLGK